MKRSSILGSLFAILAILLAAGCDVMMSPDATSAAGRAARAAVVDAQTSLSVAAAASHPNLLSSGEGSATFKLMAGQNIEVGTMSYSAEVVGPDAAGAYSAELVATYSVIPGWGIAKAHFGLWTKEQFLALWNPTLDASGQIINFKLIPGQFPNHSPDLDPAVTSTYSFRVQVTSLVPETVDSLAELFVAAHAEVVRLDQGQIVQKETAWGGGYQNGKGNWAMYEILGLSRSIVLPPEPEYRINYLGSESSFAFGAAAAVDFRSAGFSRWGWTNKLPAGTSASFPVYAGAGLSDLTKGRPVGIVKVANLNGRVTVSFLLDRVELSYVDPQTGLERRVAGVPLKLAAAHVYVGKDPFPVVKQGKTKTATVAPGQYPAQVAFDPARFVDEAGYAVGYETSFAQTGDAYVIVHGVVMFPEIVFGSN